MNNIYTILESLKRVEESAMKRVADMFDDWMHSEDCPYSDMAGDDRAVMGCAYRYLDGKVDPSEMEDYAMALTHAYHGGMDESSMSSAENRPSGSRFGGYWSGTDKGTPEPGQGVGAMEECATVDSLESRLRARWEKTKAEKNLKEYGMTTGGTVAPQNDTNNAANAQQTAQQVNTAQQNLNKLKSAGVDLPTSVGQAAKSAVMTSNTPSDPSGNGQGMDSTAKKTAMSLGQEMEKLMATGNQSQVQQIANAIKQAKTGS